MKYFTKSFLYYQQGNKSLIITRLEHDRNIFGHYPLARVYVSPRLCPSRQRSCNTTMNQHLLKADSMLIQHFVSIGSIGCVINARKSMFI